MSATPATGAIAAAGPPPPRPSLVERLRALVVRFAGEATLTCLFVPGGQLHGVGIPSALYCQTCGQAVEWHDIAEGLQLVATAEAVIYSASGAHAQEDSSHVASRSHR